MNKNLYFIFLDLLEKDFKLSENYYYELCENDLNFINSKWFYNLKEKFIIYLIINKNV